MSAFNENIPAFGIGQLNPEAFGDGQPDALVFPVPDETALDDVIDPMNIPVFAQVAGGVPHGVGVFAFDHGFVGGFTGVGFKGRGGSVERGVVIGVIVAAVALIANGTRIMRFRPGIVVVVGTTTAGFVAERPGDNGGKVFVAFDHSLHPSVVRGGEFGASGDALVAMRFNVGFVVHIEAVFIAERIKLGGIGIVGGADGVKVELLHLNDIRAHLFDGAVVAVNIGMLVAVDPGDHHGFAVDQQAIVLDFRPAESKAPRNHRDHRAVAVAVGDEQVVEVGLFRAPELGCFYGMAKVGFPVGNGRFVGKDLFALCILNFEGDRSAAGILKSKVECEGGIGVGGIERCADCKVDQSLSDGLGDKLHVAKDAAQSPEVLIFEPGTGREADYFNRQIV